MADADGGRQLRVAVVGVSVSSICGAHDHAVLLAQALDRQGISHTEHWLWRGEGSLRAARSEVRAWTRELARELRASQPDVVLLHYSVFSYSHRGLPLFARPILSALRRSGLPVVTVLHELAYAWFLGGLRGKVWSLTQRAALIGVLRVSAGVLVTTEFRAEWVASRRWLPRRPVAFAPVFSNLPAPRIAAGTGQGAEGGGAIGLFGYSYEGASLSLVLDALRELKDRGLAVRLVLLGGGGRSSGAGRAWLAAAESRGISDAVSFSGTLAPQELSDALAACDVLVSAFGLGPVSRSGTLAASLASGRPVIALQGPRGWSELIASQAIQMVEASAQALADAIGGQLADVAVREELGARGRAFAEQRMGVARTAEAVTGLLGNVVARDAA